MRRFLRRLVAFLRPGRAERELARQIAADLRVYEEEFVRRGLAPEAAARAARLAFGGVEQVKERHREARSFAWLDNLRQDIRFAARSFARTPGFTLVAVLTLALGIGANTGIVSLVYAVMLRPLPYPHPEQLVHILEHLPASMQRDAKPGVLRGLEARDFVTWQRESRRLSAVAAYDSRVTMTLGGKGDEAIRLTGASATPSLFSLLGVPPSLGPGFAPNSEDFERTVVLSASTWRRVFASSSDVVGRSVTLDDASYRIVGVMPDGFAFPNRSTAFWVPLIPRPADGAITDYETIGRLRDDASPEAAQAEASGMLKGLHGIISPPADGMADFEVVRVRDDMIAPVRQALLVLLAGVGFVLLITCANVANLVLARNASRQGEAAIRVALGAGRARLVRQLLTESAMLGLVGGAAGLAVAAAGLHWLRTLSPADLPRLDEIQMNRTVLAFSLGLSAFTGLLLGALPALRVSRSSPIVAIKADSGARASRRDAGRSVLVVAEIALATVLLAGGGLLLRSFVNLAHVNPGFNVERLLVFQVALPRGVAPRAAAVSQSDVFRDRLQAVPGVKSVAFSNALPLRQRNGTSPRIEGFPATLEGRPDARIVSTNYVQTLGIPLLRGRGFEKDRATGAAMTVLVNATLAHAFGDDTVLGAPLTIARQPATIVGVVADTHEAGLDRETQPLVYIDARDMAFRGLRAESSLGWAFYAVRATGDPQALIPEIHRVLHELIPAASLELDTDSMDSIMAQSVSERRFYALVFGLFAALAVALAALGVYGVMAYAVTQRTREIGIRIALGARGIDVLYLVASQGVPLTIAGIALGLAGASAVTRFLEGMLFGLTPLDPTTFAGVAVLLALVATVAALIPAGRATRVDPLIALRSE